jgi:hypothetical protein
MIEPIPSNLKPRLILAISQIVICVANPIDWKKNYRKKEMGILDPANVCMIVAKTDEAKMILSMFIDADEPERKVPNLDYSNSTAFNVCKYSMEYLKKMFDFFELCEDTIKISMKKDFPITFENDHFKIILAPRIESD